MIKSNYEIIKTTSDYVLLKDIGPWDKFKTITNDAENVVKELFPILNGRRLYYIDSYDDMTELIIKNGKFKKFKSAKI